MGAIIFKGISPGHGEAEEMTTHCFTFSITDCLELLDSVSFLQGEPSPHPLPQFVFSELSLSKMARLQELTFSFFGCVNIMH